MIMNEIYRDWISQLLVAVTILTIAVGIGYLIGCDNPISSSHHPTPHDTLVCVAPPGVIYGDDLDFMVWSYQNVSCGNGCNIDADHHCNITCGCSCYIDCGAECVVQCGNGCNIAHGKTCSITHGTDCNAWLAYPE
jgi:hypothetical protein